jgi:uncharacterized membrane protein YbhN (UPF0104 family)
MDKRKLKIVFKISISCLFIGYLSFIVDLSFLADAIGSLDVRLYIISTLLAVFSSIIVAAKYYCLIKESTIKHSLFSLIKINFMTRFYALFLPSTVGKEAVRWIKVTRNQKDKTFFLASILFERLTFLSVLLLCGLIPLFFYKSNPEIELLRMRIMPAVAIGLCLVTILISFYIFQPARRLIKPLADGILRRIRKIVAVDTDSLEYSLIHMNAKTFYYTFGLSLIWQISFICRLFVLIRAASLQLGIMDVTWIGSLVLLLQTIPISLAGIGLREGAYAYLFTFFHLAPENGVMIGILFFSQMLIIAFVGGILELFE